MRCLTRTFAALCGAAWLAGCGGGTPTDPSHEAPEAAPEEAVPSSDAIDISIPQLEYTWNPQAGDKSVPPELGGPGFTGEGWTTNLVGDAGGSPDAVRGGEITRVIYDWPATLRMVGKDWNVQYNYAVYPIMYMGLLGLDTHLDFTPLLATHWQISEDKSTYRFRINPEAMWADGKPVVAEDVVASWRLRVDPTILDPNSNVTWGKFHEPKAISKYIVEVKVKQENWRNFLYFATAMFWPAHEIGGLTGKEYLDKYQFAYTTVNGPYEVREGDIVTGQSLTVTRRDDWWGDKNPSFTGQFNFDKMKFIVVKDPSLAYEKAKKGEIDYMTIRKAQWWAEDLPEVDAVKRGLLVRRKFFNDDPIGTAGIAINMQRPPLDDLRIRKALQLVHDRETLIEKLYYNEYLPLTSYWQGPYANPDNELYKFDLFGAVELLEEAGWTELNDEGYRVKDGEELSFSLSYESPLSERGLTNFQENAKKAGIRIELQLLTQATRWKNMRSRQYDLTSTAWGAIVFPNPEHTWHSRLAAQVDNNNVTGFADPRVDELCDAYDREYDAARRLALVREMDGIIYKQHPYVLEHYGPARRMLYWNKFKMPKWSVGRFSDEDRLLFSWWVDPELDKQVEAGKSDDAITMEAPSTEDRFWQAWNAAQAGGGVPKGPE